MQKSILFAKEELIVDAIPIEKTKTYLQCVVWFICFVGQKWTLGGSGGFAFCPVFFIVGGFVFCPVFSSLVVLLFAPTQHFQKVLSKNIFYRYFFFGSWSKKWSTHIWKIVWNDAFLIEHLDISRCHSCSALCVCVFKHLSKYKHVLSEMEWCFPNLTHRSKYLRHLGWNLN